MNNDQQLIEARALEIKMYQSILKTFNISFLGLASNPFKEATTKMKSIEVAKAICGNEPLELDLYRTKEIPYDEVSKQVEVSEAFVKKNRDYIIALIVIFIEDFDYIGKDIMRLNNV